MTAPQDTQTTDRRFDTEATVEKIEGILAEFAEDGDSAGHDRAEHLVRLLVALYGEGLTRIATIVAEAGLLDRLVTDDLVSSLFVTHDLHPRDITERITTALDEVRPYLGSHAGGVEFLGVDDSGVARLRLEGTCHGCPSSAVTSKLAIERAVLRAAPEIIRVDVEGVVDTPASTGSGLLQIQPAPHHVAARMPDLSVSELECPVPGVRP